MCWLGECFAAALDPIGDPGCHLFVRDSRLAEKLERFLRVAEQGVGSFRAFKLNGFAEVFGEVLSDSAHAEELRAGDVDDKWRRGGLKQTLQAHVVGVGLPDGVEIAHGKRDWCAGMNALRDVYENTVAKFGGVVEAEDGSFDVCCAAEVFEDAFAAEATDGVFADRTEFIAFLGTAACDRRKAVDIASGECGDSAVAKTIADEAGKKYSSSPR